MRLSDMSRSMWSTRLAVSVCLSASLAGAQGAKHTPTPPQLGFVGAPAGSPPARAERLAQAGDTAAAMAVLDSAVRSNRQDGTSWYLLGRLQWEQARSARKAWFMNDQRAVKLLIGADSALRLAAQFAPDSARFWLALGSFSRQSGFSFMRFAATSQFTTALRAAEASGDRLMLAHASDMVGITHWIRYEATTQGMALAGGGVPDREFLRRLSFSGVRDYFARFVVPGPPNVGMLDYMPALEHFEKAVRYDSTNLRYSRHLFMALAARNRWEEIASVAAHRARQFPLDYQAQLALGLATHRLGRPADAQRAFDSAFVVMDDGERRRLTRFTRLLKPKPLGVGKLAGDDSATFANRSPEAQEMLERLYWAVNDPIMLTPQNERRLEFLARAVYADLLWTDEDLGYKGADTDRGDVYIRYGPPDFENRVLGAARDGVIVTWAYVNGMVFRFTLMPGFGVAFTKFSDRDDIDSYVNTVPAAWDNVPGVRDVDSIPVYATRFRAVGDSTDAVITARVPLDSLVGVAPFARVPVDLDFRIFDQYVRTHGNDAQQVDIAHDSASAVLGRQWTRRLGPGISLIRVEALQADTRRAARGSALLTDFATTGFGMSDVLLGDKPSVPAGGRPQRWRDVPLMPNAGLYRAGSAIGLVWELYELAARDGANAYRVQISVERVAATGVGGLALRVLDGVGRALTGEQKGRNRIDVSFDRRTDAAQTLVEYLSLDIAGSPAGRYRLRVHVEDLHGARRSERETEFVIR